MRTIIGVLAITILLLGCASNPVVEPRTVVLTIDGNVEQVIVVTEHPCEGNWNFCDQVMDDLDSFYIPAF